MGKQTGLDLTTLQALRAPARDLTLLVDRIAAHLDAHDGYVAFSGGKDSTVVLDMARRADPNVPVCFFDSGLEFPETLAYIDELTDRWNLNLQVIPARPTALEYLQANGSWTHEPAPAEATAAAASMHKVLITEPARRAHQRHGDGELWGIRAQESRGRRIMLLKALATAIDSNCAGCCPTPATRRAHTAGQRAQHGGAVRRVDRTVAFSPVWDWTADDIYGHLASHSVPVNPVYNKLRELGAPSFLQRVSPIVDANSLGYGRIVWLHHGWPDLYDRVRSALPRIDEFC